MNLAEIRYNFISRCGRYDLVGENNEDAGANFFIQSGQRFLDRRSNVLRAQKAVHVGSLMPGQGFLELPKCWLLSKVEVLSDWGREWLELQRLHTRGATRYAFRQQGGAPAFYIAASSRVTPRVAPKPANEVEAGADAMPFQELLLDTWSSLTLEILPTPAVHTTVRVSGNFYSEELIKNDDTSFWSIEQPDLLIKAALYNLEIFYRNSEGAQDWLNSIQLDLTDLEQMEVLADIQGKDVMGL